MQVTDEQFTRFRDVYSNHDGDVPQRQRAALDDFLTTTKVAELEALPQRDYRKEMWIAAWNDYSGAPAQNTGWADEALNEFDKRFPS